MLVYWLTLIEKSTTLMSTMDEAMRDVGYLCLHAKLIFGYVIKL